MAGWLPGWLASRNEGAREPSRFCTDAHRCMQQATVCESYVRRLLVENATVPDTLCSPAQEFTLLQGRMESNSSGQCNGKEQSVDRREPNVVTCLVSLKFASLGCRTYWWLTGCLPGIHWKKEKAPQLGLTESWGSPSAEEKGSVQNASRGVVPNVMISGVGPRVLTCIRIQLSRSTLHSLANPFTTFTHSKLLGDEGLGHSGSGGENTRVTVATILAACKVSCWGKKVAVMYV